MGLSNLGLGINLNVGGNANTTFSQLGEKFGSFTGLLPGGISGLAGIAGKLGLVGLAITAAVKGFAILKDTIAEALDVGGKFEYGMAEVHTLFKESSEKYFPAVEQSVRDLAVTYGQELPVMTKAMYQAISAGVDIPTIGQFFDVAGKLAVGGVTDIQTAVDGLTSVVNAYGYDADQTKVAADQMFIAMREGKTTIKELSGSMGQIAPIAANVGIGLDQVLAATASLTLTGLSTGEAVTGVRQTMLELLKVTPKMAAAAKKYGIDTSQSTVQQMGFVNWLKYARTAVEKHGGKLTDLFRSAESINAVMSLTGRQFGTNAKMLEYMSSATGSADKAFGKIAATGDFLAMQTEGTRKDMLLEIDKILSPVEDVWNKIRMAFFQTMSSIIVWWKENFLARYIEIVRPVFTIVWGYLQLLGFFWKKYFQGMAFVAVKVFKVMTWPVLQISKGIQIIIDLAKLAWEWLGKFAGGIMQKWPVTIAWLIKWLRIIGEEIAYRWKQAATFAEAGIDLTTKTGRAKHSVAQAGLTAAHEKQMALIRGQEATDVENMRKGVLLAMKQQAQAEEAKGPKGVIVENPESDPVNVKSGDKEADYLRDMFFRKFAYSELTR